MDSLMMVLMSRLFLISLMATCQGRLPAFELALHCTDDLRETGPTRSMILKHDGRPSAWLGTDDADGR